MVKSQSISQAAMQAFPPPCWCSPLCGVTTVRAEETKTNSVSECFWDLGWFSRCYWKNNTLGLIFWPLTSQRKKWSWGSCFHSSWQHCSKNHQKPKRFAYKSYKVIVANMFCAGLRLVDQTVPPPNLGQRTILRPVCQSTTTNSASRPPNGEMVEVQNRCRPSRKFRCNVLVNSTKITKPFRYGKWRFWIMCGCFRVGIPLCSLSWLYYVGGDWDYMDGLAIRFVVQSNLSIGILKRLMSGGRRRQRTYYFLFLKCSFVWLVLYKWSLMQFEPCRFFISINVVGGILLIGCSVLVNCMRWPTFSRRTERKKTCSMH